MCLIGICKGVLMLQAVGGSNPSSPTKEDLQDVSPLFLCIFLNLTEIKYYLCEGNDILLYGLCGH